MLSNFDLEKMGQRYRLPYFSVISKDQLTTRIQPCNCILNMENEYDEKGILNDGTHWVALYVDYDHNCFYFDSFGFAPAECILKYMRGSKKRITYNSRVIQNIRSSICGLYCLRFLVYMNRRRPEQSSLNRFEEFVDMFSDDVTKNDDILKSTLSKF
jgi:hypothetical protein